MRKISLILLALVISFSCVAEGRSLWLSGEDLYSGRGTRDFRPGDIITIIISEESNAQSRASTNSRKGASIEASAGPNIPIVKDVMNRFTGQSETKSDFDGQGSTARSGTLSGTVTATVLEVMNNGNLLIQGERTIRVNNETQLMRVKGVARVIDVNSDNQINSRLLADAEIKFDGKGVAGRANRPGLLTRIFNTVF